MAPVSAYVIILPGRGSRFHPMLLICNPHRHKFLHASMMRVLRVSPRPRVARFAYTRALHLTPSRLASEVPKDPLADPSVQAFYEKIRNHQGAIDAMMDMRKIMESKGRLLSWLKGVF